MDAIGWMMQIDSKANSVTTNGARPHAASASDPQQAAAAAAAASHREERGARDTHAQIKKNCIRNMNKPISLDRSLKPLSRTITCATPPANAD